MRRRASALVALVSASGCVTPAFVHRQISPAAPFVSAPDAPDYRLDWAWLSLPGAPNGAEVALPELPATRSPAVDVFYVHPTTSIAPRWNTAWDDPDARAGAIAGGTRIQASVFNGVGAIYAPSYRQATGTAFTHPSSDGDRAIDIAYSDVLAAFEEFVRRAGSRRPFIVAGHSQGAFLAARLLRDPRVDRSRLVAAYLVGAPLRAADLPVRACDHRDETGCIVTFNARAPGHVRNELDFDDGSPEADRVCVNPILGRVGDRVVPKSAHAGAVFFDADEPRRLPAFTSVDCRDGRLEVRDAEPLPSRGFMSWLLLELMGGANYHPIEYQLFYVNLRADAARRVGAFLREWAGGGS